MHTTIIGVDIPQFGDPHRNADIQRALRHTLYENLERAFAITGLPWRDCHREDRGDGALIVLPPQVPSADVLDPFSHHLTELLRRSNQLASTISRLRMRIAIHTGEIHRDAHGVLGQPLTLLYRLLDSPAFKTALQQTPQADLGVLVSDPLYQNAAGSGLINPAAYRPLRIHHKETHTLGHLWLPPNYRPRS
jgi:hypothetical protein